MALTAVFIPPPRCGPGKAQECRETDLYKLFTVLVKDQNQAVGVCRRLVAEEVSTQWSRARETRTGMSRR